MHGKGKSTEQAVRSFLTFINLCLLILAGVICYYSFKLPDNFYITNYGGDNLFGDLPRFVSVEEGIKNDTAFQVRPVSTVLNDINGDMTSTDIAQDVAVFKLFNVIPIKRVTVTDIGAPMLIPSGEPFGIKMLTDGVMVTDVNGFETEKGYSSPAQSAGIRPGDVIKTVAGEYVRSNKEIAKVITGLGDRNAEIVYIRDGHLCSAAVTPAKSSDGVYKIGIWVRDSSAGIGTLTFYDPEPGGFAGLGHPVCDALSGELLPLASGEAVGVTVNGVVKGRSGYPGELTGIFLADTPIGELLVNSHAGVYGRLSDDILSSGNNPSNTRGGAVVLPLGTNRQIKEGEAYILSTVEGENPRLYSIAIEDIDSAPSGDGKDMVIRVTDETLIEKTGGIVQGMSGSPIIQDGRLVGAVTHVFVNNPQKGYGIFADAMYATERAGQ
jgi:stage IV sporulation protein B